MLEQLQRSAFFEGLEDSHLESIKSLAKPTSFPKGAPILQESDAGEQVVLVTSGRVDVYVSLVSSGDMEVIATLKEGELVGEMVLLGKQRRSASVVAKDDVTALIWEAPDLLALFDKEVRIGYHVMRNIATHVAGRLINANQVLRNALTIPSSALF